jgi:hypothetical protein
LRSSNQLTSQCPQQDFLLNLLRNNDHAWWIKNRAWWRICTMAMRDDCLKQKKCVPSLTSVCCCLFPCTSADGWMFIGRSPCDFYRTWKPVHTMLYIRNWRKHLN